MIDLSNNNAQGHNFRVAYVKGGQRRVYLKRSQGAWYVDKTFPQLRASALNAGLMVGAYDFLEPLRVTPAEAAGYFLGLIGPHFKHGRDLRPCLDCEHGQPSAHVGRWVEEVASYAAGHSGVVPLIYGSGWWLEACHFTRAPGPLWLAAYGRDDGREYPIGRLPGPWRAHGYAAHQYTSHGRVLGIRGLCDLSRVVMPQLVDVPA
jgi:GH25 family lysozyme M1 (1,4-beta-N-acetylmuramidase)